MFGIGMLSSAIIFRLLGPILVNLGKTVIGFEVLPESATGNRMQAIKATKLVITITHLKLELTKSLIDLAKQKPLSHQPQTIGRKRFPIFVLEHYQAQAN